MSSAEVVGLTEDRERVILRVDEGTVEVSLVDIHRAERQGLDGASAPGVQLSPRVIQQRIRAGETAEQLAREAGVPLSTVARYEGPALAERAHHASAARQAEVDGRLVDELVAGHFAVESGEVAWDAWLVAPGRWQVEAAWDDRVVRLRWEPAARRVIAGDDASRRALKQAAAEDALTAVLRPVSTSEPAVLPRAEGEPDEPTLPLDEDLDELVAEEEPAVAVARQPRKTRAEVPLWSDITLSVGGRPTER